MRKIRRSFIVPISILWASAVPILVYYAAGVRLRINNRWEGSYAIRGLAFLGFGLQSFAARGTAYAQSLDADP